MKKIIYINLFLGIILWLGLCTDYSLSGNGLDILLPLVVGCLSLCVLIAILRHKEMVRNTRYAYLLTCVPSIAGGCLFVISVIVLFVSGAILGGMFYMAEMSGEQFVEQVKSPDGRYAANIYFRPVGAYTGGNGRILIRVTHRWLPFIEHDVHTHKTFRDPDQVPFIEWTDNNTINVLDRGGTIKVRWIKFQWPWLIRFFKSGFYYC